MFEFAEVDLEVVAYGQTEDPFQDLLMDMIRPRRKAKIPQGILGLGAWHLAECWLGLTLRPSEEVNA